MSQYNRRIDFNTASKRLAPFSLETMSWQALVQHYESNEAVKAFAPRGVYAHDPRDDTVTLFNERRAQRPHDYAAHEEPPHASLQHKAGDTSAGTKTEAVACPICAGNTTPIVDLVELHEGFTFINGNLYPIVAPQVPGGAPGNSLQPGNVGQITGAAFGAHFLQWTSSYHDEDWPELTQTDRTAVMERLARLEACLLNLPDFPIDQTLSEPSGDGADRHVSIIKNVGRTVGGSLSHGHQQITLTNVAPRRVRDHKRFEARYGNQFSRFMHENTPEELTVAQLETGKLVVPHFMRRPYDMQYLPASVDGEYLNDLTQAQLRDLADGVALGMQALEKVLLSLGKEIAYNILFHTGPGAGVYLEFLPRTQENGGYEHLGLSACQAVPAKAAEVLREAGTDARTDVRIEARK